MSDALQGQYYDAETDLFENWNRYYDPGMGRYLQPERLLEQPTRLVAGLSDGIAMPAYSYAANNPMYYADPNGLEIKLQNCSDKVHKLLEGLKASLRKSTKCHCKTLLDRHEITDQVLGSQVYTMMCSNDGRLSDSSDDCGYAHKDHQISYSEFEFDVDTSGKKNCGNPIATMVHELRHSGPRGFSYVHKDGDIFDQLEQCISPDGSVKK